MKTPPRAWISRRAVNVARWLAMLSLRLELWARHFCGCPACEIAELIVLRRIATAQGMPTGDFDEMLARVMNEERERARALS